ncbi:MAG: phosphopantothenoylcysteine decarboxylase [Elusimicrobia bacterium]|nr:phosphopantothenoylcysteine decarboxylase [Elusimicrobiota bacterium]
MKPTFLITSGPTREFIDPVRFISNSSSGKMGEAIAREAVKKAQQVIVISGPSQARFSAKIKCIPVVSSREMFEKTKKYFSKADIIIGAAAVSDYRPKNYKKQKIKKNNSFLNFNLVKNPDILSCLGKIKGKKVLVGFALETHNILNSAKKKLKTKNLDFIVANSLKSIGSDKTTAWLIDKCGIMYKVENNKNILARRIIDESIRIWKNNKTC